MRSFQETYARYFCRKRYYKINMFLYRLSLRGMGILNYQNEKLSGEHAFIMGLNICNTKFIVFDIGANQGNYSLAIKREYPLAQVYAFEPHPKTYSKLEDVSRIYGFKAINSALGDKIEQMALYDHKSDGVLGTEHASIYRDVIEGFHGSQSQQFIVNVATVDKYMLENSIDKIDLLKIDTEGNELNVLRGATDALKNNRIDMIHFEFNSLNVFSRVFMKDYFDLLKNFSFFRMLTDGLIPIKYDYVTSEIFAFQNIVAVRVRS